MKAVEKKEQLNARNVFLKWVGRKGNKFDMIDMEKKVMIRLWVKIVAETADREGIGAIKNAEEWQW